MIGGIIGDMIGSRFEGSKVIFDDKGNPIEKVGCNGGCNVGITTKLDDDSRCLFPEYVSFTDDTVLMVATSRALSTDLVFEREYLKYFELFSEQSDVYSGPGIGYGCLFLEWAINDEGRKRRPYGSFGNGSAMRVPPIAYFAKNAGEVFYLAQKSAECTHNHPRGIEGASILAFTIFLARKGHSIESIKSSLDVFTDYDIDLSLDDLIENYDFNPTCQGSIPQATYLALLGPDFKTVMINCMRIGGDTDTIACMAGEIAYHLYGAPDEYIERACRILKRDGEILLDNLASFYARFTDITLPDINSQPPKRIGNWLSRKFT